MTVDHHSDFEVAGMSTQRARIMEIRSHWYYMAWIDHVLDVFYWRLALGIVGFIECLGDILHFLPMHTPSFYTVYPTRLSVQNTSSSTCRCPLKFGRSNQKQLRFRT